MTTFFPLGFPEPCGFFIIILAKREKMIEDKRKSNGGNLIKYKGELHSNWRGGIIKEKRLIQGHHKDYSKPFEVEWLCSKCHGLIHRGHKKTMMSLNDTC